MADGVDCFYIGIDVGTGSARAGIFDRNGRMAGSAAVSIETWNPEPELYEQSSENIWQACGKAVRDAMRKAGLEPEQVRGVGFDGTSSQVVLDEDDRPVTISPTGTDERNVILWMDHRSIEQADRINAAGHDVLQYVGGAISPEMGTPKTLWLKENMPETWKRMRRIFELPDFLTYRATSDDTRSLCCAVCKWTYLGHEERWDDSYWRQIGLGDVVDEGYVRVGTRVRAMGEPVGDGLTQEAAEELGLAPGTPVGVSIVDAHAGGLGLLGARLEDDPETLPSGVFDRRLAMIGGTSGCLMSVSKERRFIPGTWGPYFSAMVPGLWLTEGGQTASGSLVDHVIFSHARAQGLEEKARSTGRSVYQILNDRLDTMAEEESVPFRAALTRDFHVQPDFHGNRSPRADATLKGMISGLSLSGTVDDVALLYYATIQALAHGIRHIISEENQRGYGIDTIFACGGGTRNPVFLQEHADATGCRIVLSEEPEAVLLGSAILGATACGDFESVPAAMAVMGRAADVIEPAGEDVKKYHDAKHRVYHRMYEDQMAYRELVQDTVGP